MRCIIRLVFLLQYLFLISAHYFNTVEAFNGEVANGRFVDSILQKFALEKRRLCRRLPDSHKGYEESVGFGDSPAESGRRNLDVRKYPSANRCCPLNISNGG